MKKILLLFVAVIITVGLFAQMDETEEAVLRTEEAVLRTEEAVLRTEEAIRKSEEAQKKVDEMIMKMEGEGVTDYNVEVIVDDDGEKVIINKAPATGFEKPFIGITYEDLTLSEAAEIGYEHFYGIRLTSVVPGSAAYHFQLRKGDILMAVNDDKIADKSSLGDVISYYRVKDKVKLHIFRKGQEKVIDFVFGTRDKVYDIDGNIVMDKTQKDASGKEVTIKTKKKVNYGDGSIAWRPTWYTPEVEDINQLLHGLGFEEETYSEDGIFMNGIGLRANIGNGWFIGGQYTGYFAEKNTRHLWDHTDIPSIGDATTVDRTAKYWIRYGGLSFDRRFIISKKLYTDLGCLITWGMNKLQVEQRANSDSPDYNFEENLNEYLDDYYNIQSSISLENYGFIAQPRFSIGWRVNDWLSFKAEAAYMYSVYMSGWEADANGNAINIINKPDTNMDGLTFSVGPWFGF